MGVILVVAKANKGFIGTSEIEDLISINLVVYLMIRSFWL